MSNTALITGASAGIGREFARYHASLGGDLIITARRVERDLDADLAMIDLNVKSLVSLCHMIGRDMAARGAGKILNVSSTASYMPGPLQATYFATKAFVSSFSYALAEELADKGVTVTALEPGYVETEFAAVADLENTSLTTSGKSAASVAKVGYDAMLDGKLRVINERMLAFQLHWLMPLMPMGMKMKFIRKMQEKLS